MDAVNPESRFGDLVAGLDDAHLSQPVLEAAVRQLVDAVGVTFAAVAEPAGAIIRDVIEEAGGRPIATVVGTPVRTSPSDAAWANGALAHLLDFDDTGFSHPTACIYPAALAMGEYVGASGRQVIAAMVLGYEVFERLALTGRAHEPALRRRGVHPTSVWGAPAAAAAAARLLRLDATQVVVALGIAASNAAGLTQQFGTWSKGLNAGNAARSGVLAALLARKGYRGDPLGLSGPYGLISSVLGVGPVDWDRVLDGLGERWSILDPGVSIKPYPACTSTLRAIDSIIQITGMSGYRPELVESIAVDVHPDLLHTLRYRAPEAGFSGKFSLDFTVAAAALDGDVTIESFSDAAAARPAFREMLERVNLRLHPEWDLSRRYETPVEVQLSGGPTFQASTAHHRGSRLAPLTELEIDAKFRECAGRVLDPRQADQVLAALRDVTGAASIREVTAALSPS